MKTYIKAPQTPLRSPDISMPLGQAKAHAPKKGESRFVSKGRRSMFDTDIPVKAIKKAKPQKESVASRITEVKGKTLKDGAFQMTRRANGKFIAPLVFDASLMAKLNS